MRNTQSTASEYYTLNFRPAGLARSRISSYTVREVNDMDKEKRKQLQNLWKQHGETGFEQRVAETLEYENPEDVSWDDLDTLLELCLSRDDKASRIYR
jgi:hypothetical protein